jgi:hypothetical protein
LAGLVVFPVMRGAECVSRSLGFGAEAMITLFVLPLILAFAPVAGWALRVGGLRRLWLLCALTLLAFLLVALFLSAVYSVPSVWRVIVYFLAFVGPSILFATGSLTRWRVA